MKIFSLVLGISLLSSFSVQASRDCKQKYRTVAEQIASLSPQGELDLFDIDLFEGGSVVAGYEYEVEPAYTKGLYSRVDRWLIGSSAVPGTSVELNENIDFNLSGGIRGQTEATFIRFMTDPCEAMLANPYSPKRIPLKTKVALGPQFKKGDYFFFRGSVGFVTSAEILSMLGSTMWGAGLSGNYLMEGFYQLHIVRLDDKHIRLKVVGHRGRNTSASLGLGFESEFDVFGVRLLDKQLERFINPKPIKVTANKGQAKIFMVDYVLDLTDPGASLAFEKVLKKVKDFKSIDFAAPFRNSKDIENSLLLDLSPLENLYREDYRAGNVSRVKRNLRTTSDQDSYGIGLHMGNKIFGLKLNAGGATARMGISNPENEIQRYLLRSWDKSWESRLFYSWSRNKQEDSLNALFSADESFNKLVPVNVIRHMRQRKNRLTYKDFQNVKIRIKKALPRDVFEQIPWSTWTQKRDEKYYNFGLRYELIMAPESILDAPELSKEEIKILYRDYILRQGFSADDFFTNTHQDAVGNTAIDSFELSLSQIAKNLEKALDRQAPMTERLERITKLKLNSLFAQTGLGFIMTLHPEKMGKLFHINLDLSSNQSWINFSYGDGQMSELYKKILTIKAALDDDALDILREAESLSVKQGTES